jgi:hypothetical protein
VDRHEIYSHGGHNAVFRDTAGQLWSTYFGPPWNERAAVLRVELTADGRLRTAD